ncbi:MAG TPA: ribosome-associated translation inhibitor RaiA [Dehalococcoidales bacterium]|nr:ribosome-associated translation inhibitor RaiA [Dehalococcoidales bacterium]
MELKITGHNVEILPTVRTYLEKKLNKLNRHLPNLDIVKVDLTEQPTKSREQRFISQITLDVMGTLLRAEERAETLTAAIDLSVPALDRQIEKFKGKGYRKSKAGIANRAKNNAEPVAETAEEPRVVRKKHFPVMQMSVEDAVNQMELLGHDFFLFRNPGTKDINLVYRRKDGNYSVIEPEQG